MLCPREDCELCHLHPLNCLDLQLPSSPCEPPSPSNKTLHGLSDAELAALASVQSPLARGDGLAPPGQGVWPGGSAEVPSLGEARTVSAPGFRGQSRDQRSHTRLVLGPKEMLPDMRTMLG